MSFDSIPHLSLGTAVLVMFAVSVGMVLLRGMARILAGSVILAISGWLGLKSWHLAPEFSYQIFGKPVETLHIILPIVTFAVSFWMLVKTLRFILSPFDSLLSDDKPRTSILTGLIVAIIPTAILFLITASLLHHFGAVEEIRAFAAKEETRKPDSVHRFIQNAKTSLDAILPAPLLRRLDPMTDPERIHAAKLVTRRSTRQPTPVIDPQTGQPYPRAIVVDDPALQNLAREGKFGTLLRHPILTKGLQDPTVRSVLRHLKLQ